jgi:hypothetical protein
MLVITLLIILIQLGLAVVSPGRFVFFCLWFQAIPYFWTWNTQMVFDTPIGPVNVIAMQVFGMCLACLLVILGNLDIAMPQLKPYKWHLAFLGFCMLSLSYAPSAAYGFRMIAKLLGPPLFMIALQSCMKTPEELQKASNAIIGSGVILIAMALLARAMGIDSDPNGSGGLGPPGMGPPVFAAHMLPVSMLALAYCVCRPRLATVAFTLLCAAAVVGAVQRTSAAALYAGFSAILLLGTRGIWRVLLPASALVALPALVVFSDTFRRRMFFGNLESQDLFDDPTGALSKINSSGRSGLWDSTLQRFFSPHPIAGSGVGSTQDYFYSRAGSGVVHSEYVRLLCEVGVIGLVLFALAALAYIWMLRRYVVRAESSQQRVFALAGIGSIVAYLIYCSTDNAFDYVNQFGIFVFGLVGMAAKSRTWSSASDQERTQIPAASTPPFPNLLR